MNLNEKRQSEYLRAKIMTARPEQLQMMLYDGAIRFAEQARASLEALDIAATHDRLLRAQRIVLELTAGLRNEVNPELCSRMAALYNYVYRLLVDANVHRDAAKLDEALGLLRYQRETWQLLMERLHGTRDASGQPPDNHTDQGETPSPAGPEHDEAPTMGRRLSIEG